MAHLYQRSVQTTVTACSILPAAGVVEVHPKCAMAGLAASHGIPFEVTCVACTYLVRALELRSDGLGALREAGWWLDLEEAWGVPGAGGAVRCGAVPARSPLEEELVMLYAACITLATKVVEHQTRPRRWRLLDLLRSAFGRDVPDRRVLADLETSVAAGLEWRLGPRLAADDTE